MARTVYSKPSARSAHEDDEEMLANGSDVDAGHTRPSSSKAQTENHQRPSSSLSHSKRASHLPGKRANGTSTAHSQAFNGDEQDSEIEEIPPARVGVSRKGKEVATPQVNGRTPRMSGVSTVASQFDVDVEEIQEELRKVKEDLERSKENAEQFRRERDGLRKLCEKWRKGQETDVERAHDEYVLLAEDRAKYQQDVIDALTAEVNHMKELLQQGRTASFALAGFDLPNRELHQLTTTMNQQSEENTQLRNQIQQMQSDYDAKLQEKDEQYQLLLQEKQTLQHDLEIEIEHAKQTHRRAQGHAVLATPTMASGSTLPPGHVMPPTPVTFRARPTSNSLVICLYEDLCGISITDVKRVRSDIVEADSGSDEWESVKYSCVATMKDTALGFSLKVASQRASPNEPWIPWIWFTPTSLQNESQEFIDRLNPLNGEFRFQRIQAADFYALLRNRLIGDEENVPVTDTNGAEDEEVIEEIEIDDDDDDMEVVQG